MAVATMLHYHYGLTVRKSAAVMSGILGLKISQSAITQRAEKVAERLHEPVRAELIDSLVASPAIYTDDTGWKIAGSPAFVMGFFNPETALFQIRPRHTNEQVREVVPGDYPGTLTTDRGSSYDAEELKGVRQNKCIAHLKRNIADIMESQPPSARIVGAELLCAIDDANALWHAVREGKISRHEYLEEGKSIQAGLDYLLRPRILTDPGNRRLVEERN